MMPNRERVKQELRNLLELKRLLRRTGEGGEVTDDLLTAIEVLRWVLGKEESPPALLMVSCVLEEAEDDEGWVPPSLFDYMKRVFETKGDIDLRRN